MVNRTGHEILQESVFVLHVNTQTGIVGVKGEDNRPIAKGKSTTQQGAWGAGGGGGVQPCRHRRGPESDTPDWASPAVRSSEAEETRKRETHKRPHGQC